MSRDIERIISNLEEISSALNSLDMYSDAIDEAKELMEQCHDVVHCVDCKDRYTQFCPVYGRDEPNNDDWFCGSGERW